MAMYKKHAFVLFNVIGDELITPIYTPPTRPPWVKPTPSPNQSGFSRCDDSNSDDEDDCFESSGDDDNDDMKDDFSLLGHQGKRKEKKHPLLKNPPDKYKTK